MIDKIYIIWHKPELRDSMVAKVEETFDIPYECILGPDGNGSAFTLQGYKPVTPWKLTEGPNPETYVGDDKYNWRIYDQMAKEWDGDKRSRDHKLGELACGIAHHRAWLKAQQDGVSSALFLEQDADLKPFHAIKLKSYLDTMKLHPHLPSYDMLYVGNCSSSITETNSHKEIYDWLIIPSFLYCLHAYILTDVGLSKVIPDMMDNLCVPDEYIPAKFTTRNDKRVHPSLMKLNNDLVTYAIHPRLVRQLVKDISGSTTEFSDYYDN